ncbi:MAG: ATP-binding protein [Bacteroidota bacterium]
MLQHFQANVILRVFLLLLLVGGVMAGIFYKYFLLALVIGIALIMAVSNLIQYLNQTNRDLANFFDSVKYNDFTTNTTSVRKGGNYDAVYEGFNLVNRKFQDIRAEKEANHQFLQTLVQHVDVGLLCVDGNGEVILMNKALQKLLRKSYLINLKSLRKIDEQLWEKVSDLKSGERELLKVNIQNNLLQLSIQAADIMLQKEPYRLISFQDIQNELEAQELMAWQKLIRILTHEIMNSVAPISSLSSTINGMLSKEGELSPIQFEQIKKSMAVIERRSEGLLDFTETYRTLTRIPPPNFQILNAATLIEGVETLMALDFQKYNILFKKELPKENLSFKGDPHLLEQVVINLVKNAIDAVKSQPKPIIRAIAFAGNEGKICLQIMDNGEGIPEDKMEQIFVPFFTTKDTGSGIGLSLSRQIIRMHKGTLELYSKEGEGTSVTILI